MISPQRTSIMLRVAFFCTTIFNYFETSAVMAAKGPHHPGGDFSRKSGRQQLDEHLQHQREHLEEDLKGLPIDDQLLTEMSEDEKNFYYFKLHDSDNNDNLDGLEMLHAATHHNHHHHHRQESSGSDRSVETSPSTADQTLFASDDDLSHIIEVIDDFIEFADKDRNGLLSYPEYINAMNMNEPKTTSSPELHEPIGGFSSNEIHPDASDIDETPIKSLPN